MLPNIQVGYLMTVTDCMSHEEVVSRKLVCARVPRDYSRPLQFQVFKRKLRRYLVKNTFGTLEITPVRAFICVDFEVG